MHIGDRGIVASDAARTEITVPAPRTDDDSSLLARCRAGDPAAWDQLVGRYERLIFSVAMRNGLTREDAADVTQMTFVALLDSIDGLRDDHRLASWLMTVARRHAWRLRRTQERQTPWDPADLGHPTVDPLADWERVATVHAALGQLGAPCRELIEALYFEADRPSYAVVAARMGRAVGSLGPLRGRCLTRLRTLLGEDR